MATYFSNALGADGTSDTTLETGKRHLPGQFGPIRVVGAFVTQDTANADILRMFTLPSSTRIMDIRFASTDSGTTGTADIGVYLAGTAHAGAVVDADAFANNLDTATAALALASRFTGGGASLVDADRGKALWQLVGLSADPNVEYDICVTTDTGGDASSTYYVEAWYF